MTGLLYYVHHFILPKLQSRRNFVKIQKKFEKIHLSDQVKNIDNDRTINIVHDINDERQKPYKYFIS